MLFLSDLMNVFFWQIFEKQIYFIKLLPVGAELFNVDTQRDLAKLFVFFRDFTNAYKKESESKRRDGQKDRQMGKLSLISSI